MTTILTSAAGSAAWALGLALLVVMAALPWLELLDRPRNRR